MSRSHVVPAIVWLALAPSACTRDSGAPPEVPLITAPLVAGLTVTQVALYQGPKAQLMLDRMPATPSVPVVARRAGLLRVHLAPAAGWSEREVLVRLALVQGDVALPPLEERKRIARASTEEDLTSTVNFNLAAEVITPDVTWSVSVHEVAAGVQEPDADAARYPDSGQVPLGASESGVVHVVVIPIVYAADRSNRLPATDEDNIARLRDRMLGLYPVADVQIEVADPFSWQQPVAANGTGWGALLNAIAYRRANDGVAAEVYYYGLFRPTSRFSTYCSGGCILGLSPLVENPWDELARASIGVDYPDEAAASDVTFVHEVGHAHGRAHAPCKVGSDYDAEYPYQNGRIGVWGYDDTTDRLISPMGLNRDFMGYCHPVWVSDYTYRAIFERVREVNQLQPLRLDVPGRWRSIVVDAAGSTRGEVWDLPHEPVGRDKAIERVAGGRREMIGGRFFPFDHLPGGILLVPESDDVGTLRVDGLTVR